MGFRHFGRISVEDSFTNQHKTSPSEANPPFTWSFSPSRFFVVCEDFFLLQKLSVEKKTFPNQPQHPMD